MELQLQGKAQSSHRAKPLWCGVALTYHTFSMRMEKALRVMKRTVGASLALASKEGLRIVPSASIIKIEVNNHYLLYHLESSGQKESSSIVVRNSLSAAEKELAEEPFVRVDNSTLVNMAHVVSISGDEVCLSDGSSVWFSRSRKKGALEQLAEFFGGTR